jgi:hypothetical protein
MKADKKEALIQNWISILRIERDMLNRESDSLARAEAAGLELRTQLLEKGMPPEEVESKVLEFVQTLSASLTAGIGPIPQSIIKNCEDARKALKKLGVSPQEIESRIVDFTESARVSAMNAAYGTLTPTPVSKGYKEENVLSSQVYVLECSHQIRSSERVGLISKGLLGKMVLCETCGAQRKVTSAPSWVR